MIARLSPVFRPFLVLAIVLGASFLGRAEAGLSPSQATAQGATAVEPVFVVPAEPGDTGFLVVAPDRGFLGNEEIRDVFGPFADTFRADLAFIPWTGDPTRYVAPALERLRTRGAGRVAILPLFLANSHSLLTRLQGSVETLDGDVAVAAPFGRSFLAEEALLDRLRAAVGTAAALGQPPAGADSGDVAVLLVGSGALDDAAAVAMEADLQRVLTGAGVHLGLPDTAVVVLRHGSAGANALQASFERARAAAEGLAVNHGRVVVVPFHLGQRSDSMMDLNRSLQRGLAGVSVDFLGQGVFPNPMATVWMAQEANRWVPPTANEIGFVLMPHGADIDWNEAIRQPLVELTQSRLVEYAFSMADPVVLGRAVSRLEARGARAIVLVRVFAQAASFLDRIEYLLGLSHEPGMSMGMAPPARVRSASVFTTLGGLEDHPAFAEALVARARALSENPSEEAVILLGHGAGSDGGNQAWLENLESIATQMQAIEPGFAAFHWANWREDWPAARDEAETRIHGIIESERAQGRTVLAIPARMTGTGPAQYELNDLDGVRIGSGFAPHPLFARWIGDLFMQGGAAMRQIMGWRPDDRGRCDRDASLSGVSLRGGLRCAR